MIDIDDVSYTQVPFQRAIRVASISLTGSDWTPKVKEAPGLIEDVRRAERRKRRLNIEAI